MTNMIYKYPLELSDEPQPISSGDVVLVAEQDGTLTVWTKENMRDGLSFRYVTVVGTGYPIPEGATHLGSAVCGSFVWHVFELA